MIGQRPGLYSTKEVAQLFDCTQETVRRWARERKIPFIVSPGGRYRFERGAIEEFREKLRFSPTGK